MMMSVDECVDTFVTIGCYRETGRLDRVLSVFQKAHAKAHSMHPELAIKFATGLKSLHDHKGWLTVVWLNKESFIHFGWIVTNVWNECNEPTITHMVGDEHVGGEYSYDR